MDYVPPPTIRRFHAAGAFGRYVIGPVGSGKSTGCIMDLMLVASQQAPASDGRRYTRMAIVRNTMQQLKTTVLADVLQLLRGAATFHVSTSTIQVRTRDIHSDWLLLPLDTEDDQQRLLSTQLTMAWINEFREVPQKLAAAVSGRVGRYPSKTMLPEGPTRYGLIGDSNPYSDGSEWYDFLEGDPKPDHILFRQPSGMSPEAENVEFLVPGYYNRLAENHSAEWVDVHVHGLNGEDLAGLAVFKSSFAAKIHVTVDELAPNPHQAIVIGMDLGRTPTAIIMQMDVTGRVLVLEELASEDMGLRQFLRTVLKPALMGVRYVGIRYIVVADPAGQQKSQHTEESAFDVFADEGFLAIAAQTNEINPRLRAVEKLLLERRGEGSALLIDGGRCPKLVLALKTNYRYKRRKTGVVDDKPEKLHPWSDLADALQYGCLGFAMDAPGRARRWEMRRSVPAAPPVPAGGWT